MPITAKNENILISYPILPIREVMFVAVDVTSSSPPRCILGLGLVICKTVCRFVVYFVFLLDFASVNEMENRS